jgi:hypothetical protein
MADWCCGCSHRCAARQMAPAAGYRRRCRRRVACRTAAALDDGLHCPAVRHLYGVKALRWSVVETSAGGVTPDFVLVLSRQLQRG